MRKGLAIITGADGGMGTEITRAVALAGYCVVMACYNAEKAEVKRRLLIEETGNADIMVMSIDLSSLASVNAFACRMLERGDKLDLLMNNAGTMETGLHTTEDGLERTVSVNYVEHYLLTRKLLPLMGKGSRIVNMVSGTYAIGKLDFPDFFIKGKKGCFWRIPVYSNTKLALTLFTFELSERLKERGVVVNVARVSFRQTLSPCICGSIRTPRQGAATAIRLLLDEEAGKRTGTLNVSCRPKVLSEKYTHHRQSQELWERTEEIVAKWL